MSKSKKPILIMVPGIGDDLAIYYAFAKRWNHLGYETHIISFGWVEITARLQPKMDTFMRHLSRFGDSPLYIIGISAGGTTAINALAARDNVQKVITVSSPLDSMKGLRNPLLAESILQAKENLAGFSEVQKARILSVHGLYDQIVQTSLSEPPGVGIKRTLSILHGPSIFVAMLFYARGLSRFLKR